MTMMRLMGRARRRRGVSGRGRISIAGAVALVVLGVGAAVVRAVAPDAAVADAARSRDAAAVRALLRSGADVNAAQGDGMTALHWAAANGDAALASTLLAAGANVRATTRLGAQTALHMASQGGHAAVVASLLAAGADPNRPTSTGATPLMLAARSGDTRTATHLIEVGGDINALEKAYGQTALMIAAGLDRADLVTLLLQRGAKHGLASSFVDLAALTAPSEADGTRQGPPGAASGPARADVAGLTRPYRYNELIAAQGGLTALHFAARQGSFRSARALVEGGADVNFASPGDRSTPLIVAIINGHFDLATYLLERGADPNLGNVAGVSPLYAVVNVQWAPVAAYPQPRAHLQQNVAYLDLLKRLLEKGADPNVRINRKVWFSGYNFDQSSVDEMGATPFWRAAYASDVDAMKLLVAFGADPSIPTMKGPSRRGPEDPALGPDRSGLPPVPAGGPGVTPLQAAAGVGYGFGFAGNSHHVAPGGMMAAVKYLVEQSGQDVNAIDADGNTAVHHAASRGDNAMILYLVSKGAIVTGVNRAGQTTVDLANGPVQRIQPFPETIALLERLGAKNNHKCVSC
jgi:ankyrin repeat protein